MKSIITLIVLLSLIPDASAEFIFNGNFESGDTGFVTEYVNPPTSVVGGVGHYLIVRDPSLHHPEPSIPSYGDHTTGSGLMMMVNENSVNSLVWGQTVDVASYSNYEFSIFVSSWVSAAPSLLDVRFNGESLRTIQAPSITGQWQGYSATWNSGSATSATIEIRNLTTADIGGDFALDDISLSGPAPIPEPSAMLLFLTGSAGLLFVSRQRYKRN